MFRLDKLRAFFARMMKTACVISSAACGMTDAAQRDGIDEIHVPFDERGERFFGIVTGVFRQQSDIIRFGHLPINVRRRWKREQQNSGNTEHPTSNAQHPIRWQMEIGGCWLLDV